VNHCRGCVTVQTAIGGVRDWKAIPSKILLMSGALHGELASRMSRIFVPCSLWKLSATSAIVVLKHAGCVFA